MKTTVRADWTCELNMHKDRKHEAKVGPFLLAVVPLPCSGGLAAYINGKKLEIDSTDENDAKLAVENEVIRQCHSIVQCLQDIPE